VKLLKLFFRDKNKIEVGCNMENSGGDKAGNVNKDHSPQEQHEIVNENSIF
jgi:hypothetical protein